MVVIFLCMVYCGLLNRMFSQNFKVKDLVCLSAREGCFIVECRLYSEWRYTVGKLVG